MSTATAEKPRSKKTSPRKQTTDPALVPTSEAITPLAGQKEIPIRVKRFCDVIEESANVLVDSITVGDNPRRWFDQTKLCELGANLLIHGQLQNIVVRDIGGVEQTQYELIGGERRLLAAKEVGLPTLRALVLRCDDVTAIEMRGDENYRREQFNAIEEGYWFRQLLDSGEWATQSELAAHLQVDPSVVSHRLSLLALPSDLQEAIVADKLSATAAAAIVPFVGDELIVTEVTSRLTTSTKKPTVEKFAEWVCESVRNNSRSMSDDWDGPKFEALLHRDQLDVRSVSIWPGVKPVERAFNVDKFDALQAEATEEERLKREAEVKERESATSGEAPASPSTISPYHFADMIATDANRFMQSAIASRLKPDAKAIRLLLCAAVEASCYADSPMPEWLADRVGSVTDGVASLLDTWWHTRNITPKNFASEAVEFLKSALVGDYAVRLDFDFLFAILPEFREEPFAEWKPSLTVVSVLTDAQKRAIALTMVTGDDSPEDAVTKVIEDIESGRWPSGHLVDLLLPNEVIEFIGSDKVHTVYCE